MGQGLHVISLTQVVTLAEQLQEAEDLTGDLGIGQVTGTRFRAHPQAFSLIGPLESIQIKHTVTEPEQPSSKNDTVHMHLPC